MADPEPITFTCGECRRRMARGDVEVTDPRQQRRVARALRTPPDLCFACAIHPGWFLDDEVRRQVDSCYDEACHGH